MKAGNSILSKAFGAFMTVLCIGTVPMVNVSAGGEVSYVKEDLSSCVGESQEVQIEYDSSESRMVDQVFRQLGGNVYKACEHDGCAANKIRSALPYSGKPGQVAYLIIEITGNGRISVASRGFWQ